MPFEPFVFDPSVTNVEEGNARVRGGEYLLEVAQARPTAEDHSGPPGAYWRNKIDEGPDGIGRTLSYFTTFKNDEKSQFGLGRLLFVCGKDPGKLVGAGARTYAEFEQLVEMLGKSLAGCKFGATVDDDVRDGKVYSKIYSVYPAAEYEERKKANLVPRPTAPAANGNAPAASPAPTDVSGFLSSVEKVFQESAPAAPAAPAEAPAPAAPAQSTLPQL